MPITAQSSSRGVGAQRDHADLAAGGVGDQLAVRGDARHDDGQLRVGERDLAGLAAGAILVDFGQEQLAVDGEHHAASGDVHRVGDDALPAFAGAFAAGLLLLGDLLVVGVGQQPARIGEQHLAVVGAVGGPDAQPQRRDQSSGPSERRNNARVPSPIVCAERGAPEVNRRVRALRRGMRLSPVMQSVQSYAPTYPPPRPADERRGNNVASRSSSPLTRAHGRILQVLRPIFREVRAFA